MTTSNEEAPRDWRRRRRGRPQSQQPRPAPSEPSSQHETGQETGQETAPEEEAVLSRPLVSFLEPALDTVAIFGAPLVVAGIIGLVAGIVVVAFVSSMRLYGYIDIAIGAGLIALVGAVFLSSVVAAFLSRTGRYGINTLVLIGAFTGIIIILNFISFERTSRLDVTDTNQFSLSQRTKDLLNDLDADIQATAFYKELELTEDANVVARRSRVTDTLDEFDARSSRFSYRLVDPDLEPEVVAKYFGARPTGFVGETVVVENRDSGEFDSFRPTDVTFAQLEQGLVTATYVATGREQKMVYFLTGHGERSISSRGPDGYDALREGLEQENYQVSSLPWSVASDDVTVPDDAALLVIGGPTSELPEAHHLALDRYLLGRNIDGSSRRENGSLIFLAEPDTPESFRVFLLQWGILLSNGYIRDLDASVPGLPQTLSLLPLNPQPEGGAPLLEIVAPTGQQLQHVYMPGAAAVLPANDELRASLPLGFTSPNSFLINDPDRTEPITDAGEGSDPVGPFVPAMLVRSISKVGMPPPPGSTPGEAQVSDIIAFGDADFLSNTGYERGSGANLFLNSANFLMGDFSLVSIRPPAFAFHEFNLDRNEYDFVRFASWLFLPGIMALLAGFVWWVRR